MSLTLVATPIGNPLDITLRAKQALEVCQHLILEEPKEGRSQIKRMGLSLPPHMHTLNEHSTQQDVLELAKLCMEYNVVLMSDCGTPNFCDPGAQLIKECRRRGIPVQSLPGASSLMILLSLTSERLQRFVFQGFPPRAKEEQQEFWNMIKSEKSPQVLLETPYRFQKFIEAANQFIPHRKALLACDLSTDKEKVLEGKISEIYQKIQNLGFVEDPEFIVLIYAL